MSVDLSRSICHRCKHVRLIKSGSGSTFLMCQLALVDDGKLAGFRKYPPQPVSKCQGFNDNTEEA